MKISKLLPQDSGRWVLLAVNSRGADAALVTLNVTEAAHHAVAASTAGATHLHTQPLPATVFSMSLLPLMLMLGNKLSISTLPIFPMVPLLISINSSMSCEFLCLLE